jgi:hypothetical protein
MHTPKPFFSSTQISIIWRHSLLTPVNGCSVHDNPYATRLLLCSPFQTWTWNTCAEIPLASSSTVGFDSSIYVNESNSMEQIYSMFELANPISTMDSTSIKAGPHADALASQGIIVMGSTANSRQPAQKRGYTMQL